MEKDNIVLDKIIEIEKILNMILDNEKFLVEKIESVQKELDEKIESVQKGLDQKIESVQKELNKKMDQISSRQDRQDERLLLFEHEFGRKIDMILDAVLLEQEKNIEKSEKIKKLDSRVERNEFNILEVQGKFFNLERRVCNLENNSQ